MKIKCIDNSASQNIFSKRLVDSRQQELLRKEVIQPHLPVRLPCYDLAPVASFTLDAYSLAVNTAFSGTPSFHGLTGGVYKARERIHRVVLIRDY
jgi:hypothetical protein